MGKSFYNEMSGARREREEAEIFWLNVRAVVAENLDPEHRHRVKCIIPALNSEEKPDEVHDEWIDCKMPFAGSGGHGDVAIPAVGSMVLISGEFGQAEKLYYECTYARTSVTPGDSDDEAVRVIDAPGDLVIRCKGDLRITCGRFLAEARFGTVQIGSPAGTIFNPENEGGA